MKDLILLKPIKYTLLGIGILGTLVLSSKIVYDYSIYKNLKYVKNQLKNINN